mmetsp:Transcript_114915/g.245341  ORF Transcript_114915/g.245341 Transcript_114915/m.245341 type:complete len:151 (-) Transcript_114915:52-504(-)
MGAEASSFCSVSDPSGYRSPQNGLMPMQVGSADSMKADRIDQWSQDLNEATTCGGLSCGGHTVAPSDIMADTAHGSIVLRDDEEGALWIDDEIDGVRGQEMASIDLDPFAVATSCDREAGVGRSEAATAAAAAKQERRALRSERGSPKRV